MPVQITWVPSCWTSFEFGDFGDVVFIIDAISEDIPKVPKRSFQRVCSAFFLGLFKGRSFAFAIFNVAIAYVLWVTSACTDLKVW